VIPELIEQYVDTGKARFVYREFPLTFHPGAQKASEAAVCAGEQGQYWEMNEELFATVDEWGQQEDPTTFFKGYAEELGLDTKTFDTCLDSGTAAVVVQGDLLAGQMLGVNATPTFFINDLPIRGGLPVAAMGRIIDYVAAGGETPQIVPRDDDWHMRGDMETAKAITVAFVDYANPESGEHAREVLPGLVEEYIDTGKLVYILHPWAEEADSPGARAAAAAECAGQQGQFWENLDLLFEEQEAWTESDDPESLFISYAESLDLEAGEFGECLDSDWAKLRVQAGGVVGSLYGVPGAPVYLFNNGEALEGAVSLDEFKQILESMLNQ
jgi:protein-disulfide isomerase